MSLQLAISTLQGLSVLIDRFGEGSPEVVKQRLELSDLIDRLLPADYSKFQRLDVKGVRHKPYVDSSTTRKEDPSFTYAFEYGEGEVGTVYSTANAAVKGWFDQEFSRGASAANINTYLGREKLWIKVLRRDLLDLAKVNAWSRRALNTIKDAFIETYREDGGAGPLTIDVLNTYVPAISSIVTSFLQNAPIESYVVVDEIPYTPFEVIQLLQPYLQKPVNNTRCFQKRLVPSIKDWTALEPLFKYKHWISAETVVQTTGIPEKDINSLFFLLDREGSVKYHSLEDPRVLMVEILGPITFL